MGVILLNVVQMAVDHVGMPPRMVTALSVLNIIFTAIFLAEMLMKWIAIGFKW
jgi:hypothetical protein